MLPVTGVSARRILGALIAGERDPQALAELAVSHARKKIPALIEALDGTFTDHHAFMCRHFLDEIDHLDRLIAVLDERITSLTKDHDQDLNNLDTIPGIGRRTAEIIIAQTGGDMTTFATAAHSALLDRAAAGYAQGTQRLDAPVTLFRDSGGVSGQCGPGGGLGIDRVGLALPAASLAVRPVHLDQRHAVLAQEPGQASAVGAGAFHAD